jgi:hypothetical protein
MRQAHSPWWLENLASTPITLLAIYIVFMLALISFITVGQCAFYFFINVMLVLSFNNFNLINSTTVKGGDCADAITIFQFNIKYQEDVSALAPLIEHLVSEKYHLIALQGVSQRSKRQLIEKLSPYFPNFISGGSDDKQVVSDQLLFSRYAFADIHYVKNGQSAFLITSQWQLPEHEVNLYSLHPPSPRNEKLWQTRNKTLYQLKHALERLPKKNTLEGSKVNADFSAVNTLVVGDLNISKHSKRVEHLKEGMKNHSVNSWPNKAYFPIGFGVAIDQLWLAKSATICERERVMKFSWSDHYALASQVIFKSTAIKK